MFGRDAKVSEMCSEQVAGVSIHRYYLPIPRNKVLRGRHPAAADPCADTVRI